MCCFGRIGCKGVLVMSWPLQQSVKTCNYMPFFLQTYKLIFPMFVYPCIICNNISGLFTLYTPGIKKPSHPEFSWKTQKNLSGKFPVTKQKGISSCLQKDVTKLDLSFYRIFEQNFPFMYVLILIAFKAHQWLTSNNFFFNQTLQYK